MTFRLGKLMSQVDTAHDSTHGPSGDCLWEGDLWLPVVSEGHNKQCHVGGDRWPVCTGRWRAVSLSLIHSQCSADPWSERGLPVGGSPLPLVRIYSPSLEEREAGFVASPACPAALCLLRLDRSAVVDWTFPSVTDTVSFHPFEFTDLSRSSVGERFSLWPRVLLFSFKLKWIFMWLELVCI